MNRAIISNHGCNRSDQADHSCSPIAIPLSTIRELGENRLRVTDRCQRPERNYDDEKTGDMEDEHKRFHQRKLFR